MPFPINVWGSSGFPFTGNGFPVKRNKLADAIILALFGNGEQGAYYDPYDLTEEKLGWRRNLLDWSEDLIGNNWLLNHVDMSVNLDIESGFYEVADFGSAGDPYFYRVVTIPNDSESYTFSIDLLKAESSTAICALFIPLLGGSSAVINSVLNINPVTGEVVRHGGLVSHTVEDNGVYWRISATVQNNSTGNTTMQCRFYPAYNNNINTISRSASAIGSVRINRLQLEKGSVATPYQKITDFNSDFMAQFPNHTLFQDSLGTTPVTGHMQPVGRVLDKLGNGLPALAPLSSARPLWQNNNGIKTFYRDGLDDALNVSLPAATYTRIVANTGTGYAANSVVHGGGALNILGSGEGNSAGYILIDRVLTPTEAANVETLFNKRVGA